MGIAYAPAAQVFNPLAVTGCVLRAAETVGRLRGRNVSVDLIGQPPRNRFTVPPTTAQQRDRV
jgi:hypothetical protein